MMDISDGLSSELLHICTKSNVGCRVYEDKIPIHQETKNLCNELNINPIIAALNGGEDYELLFAIRQEDYQKFQSQPGPEIYAIGYICDSQKGRRLITTSGDEVDLKAQGWRFFN